MNEYKTTLKCPNCKHTLVADIDIEAWVTKRAYEIIENSLQTEDNKRRDKQQNVGKYY